MRRVEVIERAAPQLRPHDHVAWSDAGAAGFVRLVTGVVATAPSDVELMVVARADEPDWDVTSLLADEIGAGRVRVLDASAQYDAFGRADADLAAQLEAFSRELDDVLARGRAGLCVLADNTPMLTGSDADFERWLAWEQLTDRWQADVPITGVCYFDTTAIDPHRLSVVDALHPVSTRASAAFRLFHDRTLALSGAVEAWDALPLADRIAAHLHATPGLERVVDLGRADYVHHSLLVALHARGVATTRSSGLVARLETIVDSIAERERSPEAVTVRLAPPR